MAMLRHVEVTHFQCLRRTSVPLRPLTVLVGPNDTGKSTFLRALRCLDPTSTSGWSVGAPALHQLAAFAPKSGTERPHVHAAKEGGGSIVRGRGDFGGQVEGARLLLLPSSGPEMRCRGVAGTIPELGEPKGLDVPNVVDYFLRKDRARFDRFVATVVEQLPGATDVGVETPSPDSRQLQLKTEGHWIPADEASAGVRLLLFFITLAHHPEPPELLLLEEPENGLHPRRLAYVMGLLRKLTTGALGARPVQVVLSTHSPLLLNEVDLATDQVLVFRREPDGARTAEPVDAERLKLFLDEFGLGEVWFNQSEEGLVARKDAEAARA